VSGVSVEVKGPLPQRIAKYYGDVVAEMKKVTWPDQGQLKQMTIQILVFVLVIGAVIALLDLLLQTTLIRLPQSLLR
jgi:preprotein translocase subunit SecE